jgi:hypothetical protein
MSFLQLQPRKQKSGKEAVYVHLAWSVWDRKSQRPRQNRLYVGRLSGDRNDVIVNKKFAGEREVALPVSEVREKAGDRAEFEKWLQRKCAAPISRVAEEAIARVDTVGDGHLLHSLALDLELGQSLAEAFGDRLGGALLGLAVHQVATGHALYRASDWLAQRELPEALRCPSTASPQVYATIGEVGGNPDGREGFLRNWIERHQPGGLVFFDATSVSTHSENLDMAEWGYNRDNERLPQLNYSLATANDSGLPLYYRVTPGSVPDVATLENTLELMEDFGLGVGRLSLDRGYYSGGNMKILLEHGIDVVIGVAWTSKQAKDVLNENRRKLDSPKCGFLSPGGAMRHQAVPWEVDMGAGCEPRGATAHLFLNLQKRADMVSRFEKGVLTVESKAGAENFPDARSAWAWLGENGGRYQKCLKVEQDGDGAVSIVRKPNKISAATARMGYTLILTTGAMTEPEEVLEAYRGRDNVEKMFDAFKNEDGQRRLRTADDDSAQGRFFLGFLAMAIRGELNRRAKTADLKKAWTLPSIIDELGKVKSVTTKSGKRILLEVTKKQRKLVSDLKVAEIT